MAEVFRRRKQDSRNAPTQEAIALFETHWTQTFGYPNVLRFDPEGCFRGNELASWCSSRGEDHGQIGIVESLVKKVKDDARALLRSVDFGDVDPFRGLLHVVQAHNHMDRIAGYAPAQWAFGRLRSDDGRLFEGGNALPVHSSEGTLGTDLRANLSIRVKAEEIYRKSQALLKINRALGSQPRRFQVFLPGDLVYYRNIKHQWDNGPHTKPWISPKWASHVGTAQPECWQQRQGMSMIRPAESLGVQFGSFQEDV